MRPLLIVATAALFALSGCTQSTSPTGQQAPASSTRSPRESAHAATTPNPKLGVCHELSKAELAEWAKVGMREGGAGNTSGYSRGQAVEVAPDRWEVAVELFVRPGSPLKPRMDGLVELFAQDSDRRFPIRDSKAALNCLGITQSEFLRLQQAHRP